jgi:hypothetical protein
MPFCCTTILALQSLQYDASLTLRNAAQTLRYDAERRSSFVSTVSFRCEIARAVLLYVGISSRLPCVLMMQHLTLRLMLTPIRFMVHDDSLREDTHISLHEGTRNLLHGGTRNSLHERSRDLFLTTALNFFAIRKYTPSLWIRRCSPVSSVVQESLCI